MTDNTEHDHYQFFFLLVIHPASMSLLLEIQNLFGPLIRGQQSVVITVSRS